MVRKKHMYVQKEIYHEHHTKYVFKQYTITNKNNIAIVSTYGIKVANDTDVVFEVGLKVGWLEGIALGLVELALKQAEAI